MDSGPGALDEEETQLNLYCTGGFLVQTGEINAVHVKHIQEVETLADPANAKSVHQEGARSRALCQKGNGQQHPDTNNDRAGSSQAPEASGPAQQHSESPPPDSDATPAGLEPSELPLNGGKGIAESSVLTDGRGQGAGVASSPGACDAGLLDPSNCHQARPLSNLRNTPGEADDTGQGRRGSGDGDWPADKIALPPATAAGIEPFLGETPTPLRNAQHDPGKHRLPYMSFILKLLLLLCNFARVYKIAPQDMSVISYIYFCICHFSCLLSSSS